MLVKKFAVHLLGPRFFYLRYRHIDNLNLSMGENANLLGVPNGCTNIHVVDSSVLPSITAGPITFTVMPNAMRIAKESQK